MAMKEHLQKVAIFTVNLMIVGLIICGIKEKDKNNISLQSESKEDVTPIDSRVANLQNQIATDRENKLRDLNSAPKEIQKLDTTTTKTTTTPAPVAAPKADKKTKSS